VKDALASDGRVVPAGQGDGELPATLAALRETQYSGYLSLEPHLGEAGRFGGFSGPALFGRAAQALSSLVQQIGGSLV
jgi:sugar phosphate isomerase/epimerase